MDTLAEKWRGLGPLAASMLQLQFGTIHWRPSRIESSNKKKLDRTICGRRTLVTTHDACRCLVLGMFGLVVAPGCCARNRLARLLRLALTD
ncbi:hypothetical protein CCHR01_12849 [Colletotrichum chrysophilum]|uniref:Uncharacterized protein n=1 Tax=Colletotrichum chrysophilum TaxID=1836956 RepID=A0AAD9ABQ4_9PEZI|nr:hypothetical protein CCHR01_12849 [Colletotrichum chrysophilum]